MLDPTTVALYMMSLEAAGGRVCVKPMYPDRQPFLKRKPVKKGDNRLVYSEPGFSLVLCHCPLFNIYRISE